MSREATVSLCLEPVPLAKYVAARVVYPAQRDEALCYCGDWVG